MRPPAGGTPGAPTAACVRPLGGGPGLCGLSDSNASPGAAGVPHCPARPLCPAGHGPGVGPPVGGGRQRCAPPAAARWRGRTPPGAGRCGGPRRSGGPRGPRPGAPGPRESHRRATGTAVVCWGRAPRLLHALPFGSRWSPARRPGPGWPNRAAPGPRRVLAPAGSATTGSGAARPAAAGWATPGPEARVVAYLGTADNVSRLLPIPLRRANEPVIRTRNRFAIPRPSHLASI